MYTTQNALTPEREKEFWKLMKNQWKFYGFQKRYNFSKRKFGLRFKDPYDNKTTWVFPDFTSPVHFCKSIQFILREKLQPGVWFGLIGIEDAFTSQLVCRILGRKIEKDG